MADDNNSRYRSSDPYGRGPAPVAGNNDPLAELARLIGQNDPFADYSRTPRPAAPSAEPHYGGSPAPSYGHDPAPHYGTEPAPAYRPAASYDPIRRYGDDPSPYAGDQTAHHDWYNGATAPPAYPPNDPYAPPQPPLPAAMRPYEPPLDNPDYGARGYAPSAYPDPLTQPGADPYQPAPAGYEPAYASAPQQQDYPIYPQEPGAAPMPPPHDDEFYDDAPSGRRRSFVTVVAVLTLAVIGTAGAFGYRSWFGGSSTPSAPPVIRASNEPSKVAPPPAPDQSANKFTYDRFGDAGKDEQVVRRDEKPLDLSKITPPPAATAPRAQTGGSTTNPPSAIGEPRRVRTVPIRPDQTDVAAVTPLAAGSPTSVAPPRQLPAAAPSEPRPADAQPRQAPAEPAPHAASRPAPARTSTRPARSTPATTANAPLSLSPEANNALPAPPVAQENAAPAAPRTAAPTRIASAPSTGGGGGSYLVQVSSQKSEADAENAYRGISSKYSSVLGGKPHTVRRADLGSKGVYYRAMIGPFASRDDAVSLCTSLKQAGGDCVVQH